MRGGFRIDGMGIAAWVGPAWVRINHPRYWFRKLIIDKRRRLNLGRIGWDRT